MKRKLVVMSRFTPAQRRYNRSALLLCAAYALILFGVISFFKNSSPTGVSAYAAAILPALPIIGVFVAMGRYLSDEQDEYIRMLTVRQTLWATGFALSVATIWGFLENFDRVGHVDAYYIAVLWFGGLGIGSCMNRLTLGSSGQC
jgi:hypothetical protein